MIVLIHENHDKWPNVSPDQRFFSGYAHANRVSYFCGSNFYQRLNSVKCFFTNMSTLNILFEKMIMFSPISGRLGFGHIF